MGALAEGTAGARPLKPRRKLNGGPMGRWEGMGEERPEGRLKEEGGDREGGQSRAVEGCPDLECFGVKCELTKSSRRPRAWVCRLGVNKRLNYGACYGTYGAILRNGDTQSSRSSERWEIERGKRRARGSTKFQFHQSAPAKFEFNPKHPTPVWRHPP
jgi:hypothetical protein